VSHPRRVSQAVAGVGLRCLHVPRLASGWCIRRDGHYELKDTIVNLAIAGGYVGLSVLYAALIALILYPVWKLTPLRWSMDVWWHWVALFVINDFFFYWSHRASHVFRFMWASHWVHHNSPKLNLSTGMRNSWVGALVDWAFFVPVVALGFHPLYLAVIIPVASGWDYMTHTQYVGKLPVIDFIFNSPSNHRVHHATNARYLDRNLGGMLIIWDRLFGTYAAETERAMFGATTMPTRPHNPFHLEFHLWGQLLRDLFRKQPRTHAGDAARATPAAEPFRS
jgi:sterol desaturase/sphingolipid hydroxylase (fatty acid hydroxylase superfamily)